LAGARVQSAARHLAADQHGHPETVTLAGADARPFATTASVPGPAGVPAGTAKMTGELTPGATVILRHAGGAGGVGRGRHGTRARAGAAREALRNAANNGKLR
jgi:hypothetical protein